MSSSPEVRYISECFIKPKQRLEEHTKPVYLTTWDLAVVSIRYQQYGLVYPNPERSVYSEVETFLDQLKDALSIALIHFYPLAGQLETRLSDNNRSSSVMFIDPSKGPGAKFVHADIDLSVSDLISTSTDNITPQLAQSFFPNLNAVNRDGHHLPLLIVQVTQLLDGILIGCSMNHVCCDGSSYWHFFNSWSEIFMKMMITNSGVTDDEVLNSIMLSRVPIHTRWFLDGFGPIIEIPISNPDQFISRPRPMLASSTRPPLRGRIFHFSSESIRKIKSKANSDQCETISKNEISSFQALSALMWRCVTRARWVFGTDDEETSCRLPANSRRRLNPPLSDNYFGNCVQIIKISTKAGELLNRSLGWAAMEINQAVNAHNDKMVRDHVIARMQTTPFIKPGKAKIYDVLIVSSPKFTMYENEFGLGKPVAVLSGFSFRNGIVAYSPGREGGGSIDLEICLLTDNMHALERDEEFMAFVS